MATVTHTVKSSGGDYSSLSAWEAAQGGANLVSLGDIRQAECYAFEDTTGLTIDGATTDASNYLRVYVASGNGHGGVAGVGYRIKDDASTVDDILTAADSYTRIEGVEFDCSLGARGVRVNATEVRIERCLVHDYNVYGTNSRGIWNSGAFTWYAINNIVYNGLSSGSFNGGLYNEAGTAYWYNNTVYNCGRSFNRQGGTVVAKNNIAQASTTAAWVGTFNAASDYNISDDATAPGTNNKRSATVTFSNATSRDLHLSSSDTTAEDWGADLSADSVFPFSTDIDGDTRSLWSAGADDGVSTPSGAISGTASATSTGSGTLSGAGALSGTSSGATTGAGILRGVGALSGTVSATSTGSGNLTATGALSGTSSASTTASGALTGDGALTGASSASGSATGALAGSGALSGTSSAVGTASGNLDNSTPTDGDIAGTASATSTASGTLTGSGALSGSASAEGTASGNLSGAGAMSGSASATSTASGTLTGTGAMSGSASASADASAIMTATAALAGLASALASASGNLGDLNNPSLAVYTVLFNSYLPFTPSFSSHTPQILKVNLQ